LRSILRMTTVVQKKQATLFLAITFSNIDHFEYNLE
jgi:hypothetical protein